MQRSDVASVAVGLSINRCGDWLWEAPPSSSSAALVPTINYLLNNCFSSDPAAGELWFWILSCCNEALWITIVWRAVLCCRTPDHPFVGNTKPNTPQKLALLNSDDLLIALTNTKPKNSTLFKIGPKRLYWKDLQPRRLHSQISWSGQEKSLTGVYDEQSE